MTMLAVIGLVVSAVGLALATNVKGIVTKHVRLSSRWVAPVSPLRRGVSAERLARRESDMVRIERMLGVLLLLFGLYALGSTLWTWIAG